MSDSEIESTGGKLKLKSDSNPPVAYLADITENYSTETYSLHAERCARDADSGSDYYGDAEDDSSTSYYYRSDAATEHSSVATYPASTADTDDFGEIMKFIPCQYCSYSVVFPVRDKKNPVTCQRCRDKSYRSGESKLMFPQLSFMRDSVSQYVLHPPRPVEFYS